MATQDTGDIKSDRGLFLAAVKDEVDAESKSVAAFASARVKVEPAPCDEMPTCGDSFSGQVGQVSAPVEENLLDRSAPMRPGDDDPWVRLLMGDPDEQDPLLLPEDLKQGVKTENPSLGARVTTLKKVEPDGDPLRHLPMDTLEQQDPLQLPEVFKQEVKIKTPSSRTRVTSSSKKREPDEDPLGHLPVDTQEQQDPLQLPEVFKQEVKIKTPSSRTRVTSSGIKREPVEGRNSPRGHLKKKTAVPSCKPTIGPLDRAPEATRLASDANQAAGAAKSKCLAAAAGILCSCSHGDIAPEHRREPRGDEDEVTLAEALLELCANMTADSAGESADTKLLADAARRIIARLTRRPSPAATLSDAIETDEDLIAFAGVPSLRLLETFACCVKKLPAPGPDSMPSLGVTERILLTMVKIKLNVGFGCVAVLFGISVADCVRHFRSTLPQLSRVLRVAVRWPPKEEILRNMPRRFAKFEETRVVLDCVEIPVEKSACLQCSLALCSRRKGANTIKFLIGSAPSGLITFCSVAYGGRVPSDAIFAKTDLMTKLEPRVDAIMADERFLPEHESDVNGVKLIRPPSSSGGSRRFSAAERLRTAEIAGAREHVGRSIRRIEGFKLLKDAVPWELVQYVDDVMKIVLGILNLSPPVLGMDQF